MESRPALPTVNGCIFLLNTNIYLGSSQRLGHPKRQKRFGSIALFATFVSVTSRGSASVTFKKIVKNREGNLHTFLIPLQSPTMRTRVRSKASQHDDYHLNVTMKLGGKPTATNRRRRVATNSSRDKNQNTHSHVQEGQRHSRRRQDAAVPLEDERDPPTNEKRQMSVEDAEERDLPALADSCIDDDEATTTEQKKKRGGGIASKLLRGFSLSSKRGKKDEEQVTKAKKEVLVRTAPFSKLR